MRKIKFSIIFLITLFFINLNFGHLFSSELVVKKLPTESSTEILFPYGIGIESQPFYKDLEKTYDKWIINPIASATGKSPKQTILNFYSLMALAGDIENEIYNDQSKKAGFFWDKKTKEKIKKGEIFFFKASKTLDGSSFAKSVRQHLSDEAAVELKHILDYVFISSKQEIHIPDYQDIKSLPDYERKEWKLPNTKISLKRSNGDDGFVNGQYYFSDYTVKNIRYGFRKIEKLAESLQSSKYVTPNFYLDFVHTPGLLVPPKWYASLPDNIHDFFEIEIIGRQTIFQISFAFILSIIYLFLSAKVLKKLRESNLSTKANWDKTFICFILIPLTKFSELFIDKFLNFTGDPLIAFTFSFEILYFTSLSIFVIFFFESLSNYICMMTEEKSKRYSANNYIASLRVKTFIKPITRFISTAIILLLLYFLLISIGVPTNAILALSAVPGLAIGLGSSKLLGNIISGLVMQADQHLSVGNFCKVDDIVGYVKRVGLRSIDIETIEGCVTIPNSAAESTNVINYSTVKNELIKQCIKLEIELKEPLSPWQQSELIRFCKEYLENNNKKFFYPIVTLEKEGDKTNLLIFALIENKEWKQFLEIRDHLTVKVNEIIGQIYLSRFIVRISYDTKPSQLEEIPKIIKTIVEQIDDLNFDSCKFGEINSFSYDFVVCVIGELKTYSNFLTSYDRLNKLIITKLEENKIRIPFPTTTFNQDLIN